MGSMPVHTGPPMTPADAGRIAKTDAPGISRPELRGLWIRTTRELLRSPGQIQQLLRTAKLLRLTDIYLYICPAWWYDLIDELEAFNSQVNAAAIRVWASDGERAYIDSFEAEERQTEGLQALIEYNEYVDPAARFFGFHADVDPQDTPEFPDWFHEGVPMSRLDPKQTIKRDILMHKWLNVLTRASGFLRSHDLPFSAALPYWLHEYEGEPISVPWVKGEELSTCMMDLIMPLVDQYIVLSCSTEPAQTVRRVLAQAQFASAMFRSEGTAPLVLANLETCPGRGLNASYADTPGKDSKSSIIEDIETIHQSLAKVPAFGGVAIRQWDSFEALANAATKKSSSSSAPPNEEYNAVVNKLKRLDAKG